MLCKDGAHFEVPRISVYKRLARSGKEYEFGCWVRNVIIMNLEDRIMQQHTELAKKMKAVSLYSVVIAFALIFSPCR